MDIQLSDNPKANRRLKTWEIVCLAVGCPIWLSLLIVAVAVILSLYISVWSVIVSLWAVFGSLVSCALGGIVAGFGFIFSGHGFSGFVTIGAGMVCAGLGIFLFFGCKVATQSAISITKNIVVSIKNRFSKKEAA